MPITDRESAEEWAKSAPQEARVAFAARCALRALPGLGTAEPASIGGLALPVMRAMLNSAVAAVRPTAELKKAALSAALSATSAALSATSAANTDGDLPEGETPVDVFARLLWPDGGAISDSNGNIVAHQSGGVIAAPGPETGMPDGLARAYGSLLGFWHSAPETWGFWQRWYDGMLNGRPMPWELQEKVALIPDEEWEKGPERIAELVRGVEEEFESLDPDALNSHVQKIASRSELYRDAAFGTGALIELNVARFKIEAPSNCLPQGFEAFEYLPPVYTAIGQILSSPSTQDHETIEALKAEISRLNSVINMLRRDLEDSRNQLRDARLTCVEAAQMRTFGERLQTTLTNISLVGSLGMNLLLFLGIEGHKVRYEELKASLDAVTDLMREAKEMPDVNRPEKTTEGPKFEKP